MPYISCWIFPIAFPFPCLILPGMCHTIAPGSLCLIQCLISFPKQILILYTSTFRLYHRCPYTDGDILCHILDRSLQPLFIHGKRSRQHHRCHKIFRISPKHKKDDIPHIKAKKHRAYGNNPSAVHLHHLDVLRFHTIYYEHASGSLHKIQTNRKNHKN